MNKLLTICVLAIGLVSTADADIWKWVDANGKTHFVDSARPIYTWVDDTGKRFYADQPGHEDAVSVQLVWISSGSLDDVAAGADTEQSGNGSGYAYPGETAEQRAERERAEDYYCKRATEVYESYLNAPQLYRTDANGERRILSEAEMAQTIADTKKKKDEFCKK